MEKFEFEDKINPWGVESLDDFLFFCCPECDYRNGSKSSFIKHALINHSGSKCIVDKLDIQKKEPVAIPLHETKSTTDKFVGFRNEEVFGHRTKLDELSDIDLRIPFRLSGLNGAGLFSHVVSRDNAC